MTDIFLPGVPADHVLKRLAAAGGNEVASGKIEHKDSSAALAVNAFGWFILRPELLPALPGTEFFGAAEKVEVEYCARFPWPGGRHPWLDAAVITKSHLIGVESKRYEPFRDRKTVSFAAAYSRPVWGDRMERFRHLQVGLETGEIRFDFLDGVQLIKHAYGLVTEGGRLGKDPLLFYLFAEPERRGEVVLPPKQLAVHRAEVAAFANAVAGDEITFASASYREWFDSWIVPPVSIHGAALIKRFRP